MYLVNKYNALSLPVKAAIWFIVVNFFTKGVNFITVPIFTHYMSTEEYGKVSIFLTYQGILINFATFEMYSGAYIRGILRYRDNILFFTWYIKRTNKFKDLCSNVLLLFSVSSISVLGKQKAV